MLTLEDIREALLREKTVDPELLEECFALFRGMNQPRDDTTAVAEQVRRTLNAWGPYALVTEVVIAWRVLATVADGLAGVTPEGLIRAWAIADEARLEEQPTSTGRKRTGGEQ